MSKGKSNSEIIAALAEEFVDRYRQGERPPISEYTAQHPELAEEIREFFAAVAMVENLAPAESESFGDAGSDASSAALPALKQLGDFRIIREVGRGGMGVVYEAEQVSLGRHVALKILPVSALPDDKHIRRFEREAKSAAKLHHTNIVPVFGVGTEDDLHFYVMQFIQGLPLDEVIEELKKVRAQPAGTITAPVRTGEGGDSSRQRSVANVARSLMTGQFAQTLSREIASDADGVEPAGEHPSLVQTVSEFSPQAGDTSIRRLSDTFNLSDSFSGSGVRLGKPGAESAQRKPFTYWESVANIGLQVADAMQYAHDQGILHRDIKPSNLLLDMRGTAWVTDFGLAKATDQQDITHTGDILGTLRYMPPEAFDGMADARSDVYSLGLALYELLCFQPAFGVKDRNRLIKQVTTEAAPRLEKLNPEIPRDLVTIVHKAIDRDASHRYQTARELKEDLQRFLDDEPIRARRITTAERFARWSRRNKGLAASLAAVCLLLLVINIAGPVLTWRLQEEKTKLVVSESDLREAVTELETREKQLEETGRQLKAETVRANDKAADARAKAVENERIAARESEAREEADRQRTLARRALYSSAVFGALQAIATDEGYARAQDLLDEVRPQSGEADMRGWEWYYLAAQPPLGGPILQDFSGYPVGVRFSPDGKTLAVGDSSGMVSLVDAKSGRLEQQLRGHQSGVWSVVWSPDGSRLASASGDKTARIWDLETGETRLQLLGHTMNVTGVAWAPDGMRLATSSFDMQVKTWDASSGENLKTFDGHTGAIRGVDWSSDGRRLVSAGDDQTVRLWDVETGEEIYTMEGHTGRISRVRFSPDGRRIASASWESSENPVIIWDAGQGRALLRLKGLNSGVWGVCWSSDGSQLATALYGDSKTEIWDADSGEKLRSFSSSRARFSECSWSPDGQRLASASYDQTVRIWDVVDGQSQPDFTGHTDPIRRLAWSPDGARIASASMDATVRIWDVRTKRESLTFRGHRQPVLHVDWSPDGRKLASCGLETSFQIWDSETGEALRTVKASDGGQINAVVWSPDGMQIATGSNDHTVRIFDVETGNEVQRFRANERILFVCWDPDGKQIAACIYHPGAVKVWDVESGVETASIPCPDDTLFHVSISPDGKRVAAGGFLTPRENPFEETVGFTTGVLKLWDRTTGQELLALRGHSNRVWSICWSSDGTRLLSADWDGRLILWDTATGRQLLVLNSTAPPAGMIQYCPARFSPDELQIVSTSEATGITLWDATPGYAAELSDRLLPALQSRIASNPTFDDLKLKGEILARQGQWGEAAESFERAALAADETNVETDRWFTSPWWVVGPYPEPLDAVRPPEKNLDPFSPIPSTSDNVLEASTWEVTVLGADQGLNLGRFFHRAEQISGYAQLRIYSPAEQSVGVLFGADDAIRLWFNGELIHNRSGLRPALRDDEAVDVTLQPGWNILLAKVFNSTGDHGLFLRLSDDPLAVARVFARNEKWTESYVWWDRAYTERPDDPKVLLGRGRAALAVGRPDVATECFNAALADAEPSAVRGVASAYAGHAQSLIKTGQANAAVEGLDQARSLYETLLAGEAATDQDAADLADVLLAHQADQVHWTVLEPAEMTSTGGATLTRLDDNSVLAGGPNPDHDVYHVTTAATDLQTITAIRIEALTDDSLPGQGPGRWDRSPGVFVMNKIDVIAASRTNPNSPVAIALDAATADYFYPHLPISPIGPWHIGHGGGKPHVAVYRVGEALQSTEDSRLTFTMTFNNKGETGLQLGRFRLSVTSDPAAFNIYDQRFKISTIEDRWARLGAAYAAVGDSTQATQWIARAMERAPNLATRRELVERIDQLQVDLGGLLELRANDPLLWGVLAMRQAGVGQTEAAAESLARARALTEALLAESPADEALAGMLVDLLDRQHDAWTVLEPWDFTSSAGATLTPLSDGSLLARGSHVSGDVYTIRATVNMTEVRAIRLEALPDPSLPRQGPGRHPSGNFQLNAFRVFVAPGLNGEPSDRIQLADAWASYESPYRNVAVRGIIDDHDSRMWHVFSRPGERHIAVFDLATPWRVEPGQTLIVQCGNRDAEGGINLGRFRLSVSNDPQVITTERQQWALAETGDPWSRLGAYAAVGDSVRAAEWFSRALDRTPGFSARRGLVERIDQLPMDLNDLAALRPDDPLLLGALAKRQVEAGRSEAAAESLARARRLTEALLGNWTVLEPIEMNGEAGETLTVESDGSIFVSGPNPERAIYTLAFPLNGRRVSAIRLETLPDARLPHGGAGRYPENGNFHLAEFVAALVIGDDGEPKPIPIVRASDDYHFGPGFSATDALDGNPNTRWDIHPHVQRPHSAVFTFRSPVESTDGRLIVTLDSGITSWGRHGLGRFRLSVTESPHAGESPDDESLAGFLADLLLADTTKWTVLEPIEMTSEGGATLTLQADASILASGENRKGDVYTIRAAAGIPEIRAIRLEALPDPSLPNHGPGRHPSGNFQLKAFRLLAAATDDAATGERLPIADARASYAYDSTDVDIRGIIGDDDSRIWHVFGRSGERHVAAFRLLTPCRIEPGQALIVQCAHTDREAGINLGRFRLSVTGDPQLERQHSKVREIGDPWTRLGAAYALTGDARRATQSFAAALDHAADFSERTRLINSIAEFGTDLGELAALRPDDPPLLIALARRQADAGESGAAAALLARARSLTETMLKESPGDETLAGFFADLLLADESVAWSVPEPVARASAGGARMELQSDGSIFVTGTNPHEDLYTVVLPLTSANVRALRLETLADERLPHSGSGRSPINGNFRLGELALSLRSARDPAVEIPITLTRAIADVAGSEGRLIDLALDGDRSTHWTPYPQQMLNHEAVFEFQLPPTAPQEDLQLVVRLDTGSSRWPHHGLGRFRLSVTDDPTAFDIYDRRFAVARIEDPWARLAAAYYVAGNESALEALLERKPHAVIGMANVAERSEAIARLDSVINTVRGNAAVRARILRQRGALYVRAGQWDRAATDYSESVELDPTANSIPWMLSAALWAYAGEAEPHRIHCRKMAERFRTSAEAADAERTVKVMLLMEHELDPEQAPVEPFLAALAGDALTPEYRVWFLSARALLACRSGEFDDAQDDVDQSLQLSEAYGEGSAPRLLALAVQALIHAKQGNLTAAQATVDELKSLLATKAGLAWRDDGTLDGSTIVNGAHVEHDLLIPEILRREAEQLIQAGNKSSTTPAAGAGEEE